MPPAFPVTARLVRDAFRELEFAARRNDPEGKRPAIVQQIAKVARISPASLVAWRAGKNAPSASKAEILAEHLFPGQPEARRRFLEEIARERARNRPTMRHLADPLDRLERNENVEIQVVGLPPFSSGAGTGFFERLISRFIDFAAVGALTTRCVTFQQFAEDLLNGRAPSAVAGILATVDRMRTFAFITTPVRLRVAAVIRRPVGDEPTRDEIAKGMKRAAVQGEAMVETGNGRSGRRIPIHAVIADAEVGEIFAEKALRLSPSRIVHADGADVAAYAAKLERSDRDAVYVALLDEHSAGNLVLEGRKTPAKKSKFELLFDPWEDSPLPTYCLAVATDRKYRRWCQYLAEAMEVYLQADQAYAIQVYQDLWHELQAHHRKVLEALGNHDRQHCIRWTRRLLGVPEDAKVSLSQPSRAWESIVNGLDEASVGRRPGRPPG